MSHYFWWYHLYEVKFSIRFTTFSCNVNIFLLWENLDTCVNFKGAVMTGILRLRLLNYLVLSISLYAKENIFKEHDLCLQSGQRLGTHIPSWVQKKCYSLSVDPQLILLNPTNHMPPYPITLGQEQIQFPKHYILFPTLDGGHSPST
jgi:hypothetical protein